MAQLFDPSLPGEINTAASLYQSIESADALDVFDWLIDNPDTRIEGADLAERLGFAAHKQVGIAMWEIGEKAALLDRARPWLEGQLGYLMPMDQAALFRSAREKAQRDLENQG